ncbi:MAG: YIP1 family protein [Desulfocucumaceae bacterium]
MEDNNQEKDINKYNDLINAAEPDKPVQAGPADPPDPRPSLSPPGFLELIYGVLFNPAGTFRQIAASPPMGKVLLAFSTVKVLSALVFLVGGLFSTRSVLDSLPGQPGLDMDGILRAMAPLVAFFGLLYEYIKWFVYSGILYLLAEFSGGRGRAAGVLAATGLASVPALLFLPVQLLALVLGGGVMGGGVISGLLIFLTWIAVLVWGVVLVVIGIRETQGISTGRAVLVAFTPAALSVAVIILLLLLLIIAVAAPIGLFLNQFDDIY